MRPEDQARENIDRMLDAAGWAVQDLREMNLGARRGVAVRYFPLQGGQEADYLLFVDRKAAGVIEAKPEGTTLTGVAEQSGSYIAALPPDVPSLRFEHLADFIDCYNRANRHEGKETERFRAFGYDELIQRDKVSLDVFWLKDDSLEDAANLPAPDVLAADIIEDVEAALDEFQEVYEELGTAENGAD
jgi:hypothetical protein